MNISLKKKKHHFHFFSNIKQAELAFVDSDMPLFQDSVASESERNKKKKKDFSLTSWKRNLNP